MKIIYRDWHSISNIASRNETLDNIIENCNVKNIKMDIKYSYLIKMVSLAFRYHKKFPNSPYNGKRNTDIIANLYRRMEYYEESL